MHFNCSLLPVVLFAWLSFASLPFVSSCGAHTSTVAISGAEAIGLPATTWDVLSAVTLNNAGAMAFSATLEHGGSITAGNDAGVWFFDNNGQNLLAQTGVANVPGVANAEFAALGNAVLGDSGAVVVNGALVTGANGVTPENDRGIWKFSSTSGALLTRTGTGGVAGVPMANFSGYPHAALSGDGRVAVNATLAVGVGGVLSSNDRGVWTYESGNSTLVMREGDLNVPGVPNAIVSNFSPPSINSSDQLAVTVSFKTNGVFGQGVWRDTNSSAELLTRTGTGIVPGIAGMSFGEIRTPLLNDLGQVAFVASGSSGSSSFITGVWLYSDTGDNLLARSGDGNVPGVPGAEFHSFDDPSSLNEAGQVLTFAVLANGVGAVTSDNNSGLWLLGSNPALIARSGVANVPEIPGANFTFFSDSALNEQGQVAFSAELELGVGGVDSTNDSGIWIVDPLGESRLVAREGELLAGHTIASLDFVGDGASQSGGFNDLGELAFQATFTDGDSGLFLFRPYAADFDRDGDVDADDLAAWTTTSADADSDGDTDGADFLVWQREFGSGSVSTPIIEEVPEPASWLLLSLGLPSLGLLTFGRHKRCRRSC